MTGLSIPSGVYRHRDRSETGRHWITEAQQGLQGGNWPHPWTYCLCYFRGGGKDRGELETSFSLPWITSPKQNQLCSPFHGNPMICPHFRIPSSFADTSLYAEAKGREIVILCLGGSSSFDKTAFFCFNQVSLGAWAFKGIDDHLSLMIHGHCCHDSRKILCLSCQQQLCLTCSLQQSQLCASLLELFFTLCSLKLCCL